MFDSWASSFNRFSGHLLQHCINHNQTLFYPDVPISTTDLCKKNI